MYSVSGHAIQEDMETLKSNKPLTRSFSELIDPFQAPVEYETPRDPIEVEDGLVALWDFDADADDHLRDIKSTVQGEARIVEGKVRGALSLGLRQHDNRVDSVDLSETINRRSPNTITFWILPKNDRGIILGNGRNQLSALRLSSEKRKLLIEMMGNRTRMVGAKTKEVTLPFENWTHVAIAFNGNVQRPLFKVYINGKSKACRHFLSGTLFSSPGGSTFQIGAACSETSVGGMIDELRIYDRELSAEEVTKVMNYGQPKGKK